MARRLPTLRAEPVLLLRSEFPVAGDRGPSVEEEPVRAELTIQPGTAHDLEHAGVQAHEPDRRALRRDACRALLQHLERRVLDVWHAAQVEREDTWLVPLDERGDLVADGL